MWFYIDMSHCEWAVCGYEGKLDRKICVYEGTSDSERYIT